MKIERLELHHIALELVHPFQTSFGTQTKRPCVLVAVYADGLVGWGECVASDGPFYSSETDQTAWHVLQDYLVPLLMEREISDPREVIQLLRVVRGHEMAKAGLEIAVWDWFAKAANQPLSALLGGVRERVPVGVSIGIQADTAALLARVAQFVEAGYGRIKIKIKRGLEVEPLTAVRRAFPDVMLMADANSDYELADAHLLKQLDDLDLLMIEQPLRHYDIIDHAKLQAQLQTPICLDESIHRPDDVRYAIELNACQIINMKVGRVGGLAHALEIHDLCQAAGLQMWCGGMLETGIGRATNIHLASLPNFTLPGDISATSRYWHEDITDPPFVLNHEDSTMSVPTGAGLGVEILPERIAKNRLNFWSQESQR